MTLEVHQQDVLAVAVNERLYDLYLAGLGAPANPPGSSSHEYGTAVDLASPEMRTVIDSLGPSYGWGKVHGPDEWCEIDGLRRFMHVVHDTVAELAGA